MKTFFLLDYGGFGSTKVVLMASRMLLPQFIVSAFDSARDAMDWAANHGAAVQDCRTLNAA